MLSETGVDASLIAPLFRLEKAKTWTGAAMGPSPEAPPPTPLPVSLTPTHPSPAQGPTSPTLFVKEDADR